MRTLGIELPAWLSTQASALPVKFEAPQLAVPEELWRLIQAAAGGDESAFSELIRQNKSTVLKTASRFARSENDLEEIAQDTFLQVYRSLKKFDGRCSFTTWVGKIAVRRCYDYLRSIYRRGNLSSLEALREQGFDPHDPTRSQDPRVESLRIAMRRLTPDQFMILTLLEIEDRPVREVAVLTGWSEGNVKVRALRARTALRQQMEAMEK